MKAYRVYSYKTEIEEIETDRLGFGLHHVDFYDREKAKKWLVDTVIREIKIKRKESEELKLKLKQVVRL